MIDNRKEDYTHEINRYTRSIIDGLIPKRIVPFDYYEERDVDEEVKNWIERSEGEFAVIVGDAGFGKTNLLCNLANILLNEEQYTVFFVKSENLRAKEFDKKILDDFEITGMGLNAFLREIMDEKIIFLLDTLDAIATDDGIARLDDFITKVKGENRIVIGASRPLEFKKIENLTTKIFELKPFSDDEIRRLFNKYKAFYKMEGVKLRPSVLEVCRNPLHMRMLFVVYQPDDIPEDINTQKLYDRYWENKVGGIGVGRLPYLREDEKRWVIELKDELTKKIAVEMLKKKEIFLEEKFVKEEIFVPSYIKQQASISESSENIHVVQEVHQNSTTNLTLMMNNAYYNLLDEGVLREHEKTIEFFHQTFFEYAAARALIEEEEQSRQSLFEDLLLGITSPENWRIIQQVILYAKRRENGEIAHKFLKELSETNFHTKILAIDILKYIEIITEKDVEIYQHLTKDKLEDIRLYLAASLGRTISKHLEVTIGMLETFSRDKEAYVRQATAHALPKLVEVNPELATGLLEIFSTDKSDLVQETAIEALSKLEEINPELVTGLIKTWSKDDNAYARKAAVHALLKLVDVNPRRATKLIENLSEYDSAYAREVAAQTLPKLVDVNPERATRLIKTLSKDDNTYAREAAVQALLKLVDVNPERATRLIKTLSKDDNAYVRKAAAQALPRLVEANPERAAGLLIKTLSKDKSTVVCMVAVQALPKLIEVNPIPAARLIETLGNDNRFRAAIVQAMLNLIEVNPEHATGFIDTLSKDIYWWVREIAARVLPKMVEINPERTAELILSLSKDKSMRVREVAVLALPKLVELNPERASELIETLSKSKSMRAREVSAQALLKLVEKNPRCAIDSWWARIAIKEELLKLVELNPDRATGLIETLIIGRGDYLQTAALEALSELDVSYPQKARLLLEKLHDVENSDHSDFLIRYRIQQTIDKIVLKGGGVRKNGRAKY